MIISKLVDGNDLFVFKMKRLIQKSTYIKFIKSSLSPAENPTLKYP